MRQTANSLRTVFATLALVLLLTGESRGHCDTMNGPVVKAAKQALDRGDVRYALVWVRPEDEAEIRSAFTSVVRARTSGEAARSIADRWFYETLVRVHRAGEGAPYTGLKNEENPDPGIEAAERAIANHNQQELSEKLVGKLREGLEASFKRMQRAATYKPEDVEAGRRYVEAYVSYLHYVERWFVTLGQPQAAERAPKPAHNH